MAPVFLVCSLGLACAAVIALYRRGGKKSLPPGPPPRFLVGNMFDVPRAPIWEGYAAFGRKYGPVTYLRVLNQDLVVLNTVKVATDLLEKRSAIYSDRPRMTMINEVVGCGWITVLMPYSPWWRQHRRVLQHNLSENASAQWSDMRTRFNSVFLKRMVDAPGDWWALTQWLAGANIMRMTYGFEIALNDDPWVKLGIDAVRITSITAAHGSYLVDWIPLLQYIPSWLPGAKFKLDAVGWRETQLRSRDLPFRRVVEDMANGTAAPCITTYMLEHETDGAPMHEEVVKNVAGVMYLAGVDTALSVMHAFVYAMVVFPEAQKAAQAELDRVIPGRLPTPHDRSHLPYVEAVLREVMRVYPVTPLAVAHRLMEDDMYEGMHLPKGATVIANTWAMMNDETIYPEPERFHPDRYLKEGQLNPDVLDPHNMFYGHGRRICPGRHFADDELWLYVASMLVCFDILPATDVHGNAILPLKTMTSGVVCAIAEFPCTIVLRDEAKRDLALFAAEQETVE